MWIQAFRISQEQPEIWQRLTIDMPCEGDGSHCFIQGISIREGKYLFFSILMLLPSKQQNKVRAQLTLTMKWLEQPVQLELCQCVARAWIYQAPSTCYIYATQLMC